MMVPRTLRCRRSQRPLLGTGPSSPPQQPLPILGLPVAGRVYCEITPGVVPGNSHSYPPCSVAKGNDTPVASQVINHRSISRAPEGLQLPKTARSLQQTDSASPSCHERTGIAGKTVLLFLLPGLPRHPGLHLFRAAGSLFRRDNG